MLVGSGVGYATGTGETNANLPVSGAFAGTSLGHVAPEVGYWVAPDLLISAQGRVQVVSGPTELIDPTGKVHAPADLALALFLKASLFFGSDALRPFISGGLGGGQIRHVVTFGAYQRLRRHPQPDLRRLRGGGPRSRRGGWRLPLQAQATLALEASSNLQIAEPKFTFNVDFNAGVAFSFCGHETPSPLLLVSLSTLATFAFAGCLTPEGYSRGLDAGAAATGGGAAQAGASGAGGTRPAPAAARAERHRDRARRQRRWSAPASLPAEAWAPAAASGWGRPRRAAPAARRLPPPGTVLYSDDFESDAAGGMAKNWIADSVDSDSTKGTWSVVSDNGNRVLQGAATGSDFIMDIGGDVSWTDYTFQVDAKMISGSSFELGVFGRFDIGSSNKGNYYEAYMDDSGAVQLRVRLNGSTTTLGSKSKSTTGNAQLNTVYTFKLDMHGATITVSVNGVVRISMVTDTTLSTGGIGVIVNGGTAEFDNVYVTE